MTATPLRLSRSDALRFPVGAKCIAYVRVSTERQAGETKVSPDTQLKVCARLATERGYTVDHTVEDHESGAHLERLDRLLTACQAHRLPPGVRGLICVYDTSRWGRFERPGVDRMFREQLHRLGWDVVLGGAPETGNEAADLFVGTGQAIASTEYRRQLRQKVVDNMPRVAAQGFWQGRAPFGYAVAEAAGGRRKLIVGSARDVRTVLDIFARFAKGKTLQAIAAALNEAKAPGPFDHHPSHTWDWSESGRRAPCGRWTSSSVRAILRCETYVGRIIFKPREVRDEQGKPIRFARNHVPEEHWVVVEDAHPAIVERRVFETTRRRLAEKAKPRRWSTSVEPFVLSGLMTCQSCGDVLVGGGGTRFGAGDPGATRFYRCRNSNGDNATCVNPMLTINQRLIEREVIGRVTEHVSQLVKSGKLAKLLDEWLGSDGAVNQVNTLGRELEKLNGDRSRLVKKIAEGLITDDDAREQMAAIKTRIAAVGRELQAAKVKPTRSDRKAERERLLKLAADFPALIKKVSPPVARDLLSYWVEGIALDKKGRVGTLTLRRVPAEYRVFGGSSSGNQARRAAAKRCSPDGSPPFSRR